MEHLSSMTASAPSTTLVPDALDAGPAPASPEAAAILGGLGFVVRLEAFNGPLDREDRPSTTVAKTLKCGECGSLNRPTEWYCERCGAELAAL